MISRRDQKDHVCVKYIKTSCLSLAFCALGVSIAIVGPTLPTLAMNLNVAIEALSYIFVARGGGYLVGSVASGLMFGKGNPHLLICASLCVTAVGLIGVPFMSYVPLLALCLSAAGIAMGFLDAGGNVMCLQIWGEKSGPYMQTLHFFFAFGATLAPLLSQPFIMEVTNKTQIYSSASSTISGFSTANISTVQSDASKTIKFPYVAWAFLISASFCLLVALSFCYLSCQKRNIISNVQEDTTREEGKVFRLKLLGLLFAFYFVYVGIEVTFGSYIYTFAISVSNPYSKDEASTLNTLFWGSFACGRFLSIFASKYISPRKMLLVDLLGTLIASVTMTCFPLYANGNGFVFWLAVALYGMSMSSVFPSGISWIEEYITIQAKAAAVLVVGAALGEMVCPLILGQFIEKNAMNLPYFTLACVFACILIYICLLWLANSKGKRLHKRTTFCEEDFKVTPDATTSLMTEEITSDTDI